MATTARKSKATAGNTELSAQSKGIADAVVDGHTEEGAKNLKKQIEMHADSQEEAFKQFFETELGVMTIRQQDGTDLVVQKFTLPFKLLNENGALVKMQAMRDKKPIGAATVMMVDKVTGITLPVMLLNWHASEFMERECVRAQGVYFNHLTSLPLTGADKSYDSPNFANFFNGAAVDAVQLGLIQQRNRHVHSILAELFGYLNTVMSAVMREWFVTPSLHSKYDEGLDPKTYFATTVYNGPANFPWCKDNIYYARDDKATYYPATDDVDASCGSYSQLSNIEKLLLSARYYAVRHELPYVHRPVLISPIQSFLTGMRDPLDDFDVDKYWSKKTMAFDGKLCEYSVQVHQVGEEKVVVSVVRFCALEDYINTLRNRLGNEMFEMILYGSLRPYFNTMFVPLNRQGLMPQLIVDGKLRPEDVLIFHTKPEEIEEKDQPMSEIIQRVQTSRIDPTD